ncbi:MAG: DNA translocase FtsK 4TM domain-containing protein [Anaerolineaceae bacterium]
MAARAKSTSKTSKKSSTAKRKPSTAKKSPSRTTTASRQTTRRTSSSHAPKQTPRAQNPTIPLSPERKVDIAGIILTVVGILTLLSLLTSRSGSVTGWWSNALFKAIGWGAYTLPLLLLLIGLWLLLRKKENFPQISAERIIGIFLVFFNILTWFQLISRTATTPQMDGGGAVGRFILNTLINWFGTPGTVIWLVAWLLTCLVLLVDLSMSDLTNWLAEKSKNNRSRFAHYIKQKAAERHQNKHQTKDELNPKQPTNVEISQPVVGTAPIDSATAQPNGTAASQHAWILPDPEEILDPVASAPIDDESDQDRARVIEETLRSFSTPAHVVEIRRGPTITLFGVEPDFVESRNGKTRVRVSNIVRLADDIAMALKASRIRIQAPVPGKGYVGIEVPNQKVSLVSLLEIIQSPAFSTSKDPLRFALGKNVSGQPFTADLASMPHLLIAGTTGAGKSVCINAILAGYLLTLTPDQLRIVLVDPKRVELTGYNGVPHLLAPVIVDAEKVVGALQWMQREMDLRYRMFSEAGARNIAEYNAKQSASQGKTLPFLLVVIDELADMMMLAPDETERSLTRLAQLARATGIHLILATQRPSTDILTGLIKANFPARIAFAVASGVDSRVILDQPGAERLLGKGDMLFQAPDAAAPVRLQGTYVSDAEINRLTDFWRMQASDIPSVERPDTAIFTSQTHVSLNNDSLVQESLWQELERDPDEDPITKEALALIRKEGRASISMLQRKLRIGYTRAARLVEKLEEQGIVGPPDPQTGSREVLDWGEYGPLNED